MDRHPRAIEGTNHDSSRPIRLDSTPPPVTAAPVPPVVRWLVFVALTASVIWLILH